MRWTISILLFAALMPCAAPAKTLSLRVPLENGRVSTSALAKAMVDNLHLPDQFVDHLPVNATFRVRGISGWLAIQGINRAMGRGFHLTVNGDDLVMTVDTDRLPEDLSHTEASIRQFTAGAVPRATARQSARYGLWLPKNLDENKPLNIVIHGLDGDATNCRDLCKCLDDSNRQSAMFVYAGEQPIDDSGRAFAQAMIALHASHPRLRINLITQSMGALVARDYVEGPDYAGSVDRLVMIAPPNQGSTWSRLAVLEKLQNDFELWQHDEQWGPTWMLTEGVCEAGNDLKPGSPFLKMLNARDRRVGVSYTIIAGDQPVQYRLESQLFAAGARWLDGPAANWAGVRSVRSGLLFEAHRLLQKTANSDGPVDLAHAKLAGVNHFIIVHADHIALIDGLDGSPPKSWNAVEKSLGE